MDTNALREYWKKEIAKAFYLRNNFQQRSYSRMWVRNCIWQFWAYGGIGGNPSNAKKYFPKRDNSAICG